MRAALLGGAVISAVNYAEVLTRLADGGETVAASREQLRAAGVSATLLSVVAFSEEDAIAAAGVRPLTRHRGLSLGDRASLALSRRLGRPVLTADRAWASLAAGVEVRLVRP